MVKPIDLKISTIKEASDFGVFSFEPLPKGMGIPLGISSEEFC